MATNMKSLNGYGFDAAALGGKTLAEIMLTIYPVGAVYISANSASPASLFGGTWEQLKDRFLLGAGSTYTAGSTGGKTSYELRANIGAINNNTESLGYISCGLTAYQRNNNPSIKLQGSTSGNFSNWNHSALVNDNEVNSENTTIIPPYLSVYMWKRVS